MANVSRHHHYLPQCYLKGFTKSGAKKSKLQVFDIKRKKHFETVPRNVGGVRDFNRVEIDGLPPDSLESSLSEFEGNVASALKRFSRTHQFQGNDSFAILNLVALLAVRSPQMREHWRGFIADVSEITLGLSLATQERWESLERQMEQSGGSASDISYEDIKEFYDSKKYSVSVDREHHIHMEFEGVKAILPTLIARKWLVILASEETGPFITSDHPTMLVWKNIDKIPPLFQDSPGFGMTDTQISFPISRDACILGEFNGSEGELNANTELVATLNSKTALLAFEQVYAPRTSFKFIGPDKQIMDGKHFMQFVN